MTQFSDEDNKAVKDFMCLLVNLGMTPTEAFENVQATLVKIGWAFIYFNDLEDFWITDNELK